MSKSVSRPIVAVGAVIWDGEDAVLLVHRGRPPRLDEWSIPGGKVEWGESLEEALRREIFEETGLEIGPLKLIDTVDALFRTDDGSITDHYILVDYCARAAGKAIRAGDDASEARWVPMREIVNYPMWSETRRIIAAAETLFRTLPA